MSQDVVADALNMIRNAKKARKDSIKVKRSSSLLIEILNIMKQALQKPSGEEEVSECKAIKPRFTVNKNQIELYRRRYLPSREMGTLIISTNKGLITHEEAFEEKIGGSLIAYFY